MLEKCKRWRNLDQLIGAVSRGVSGDYVGLEGSPRGVDELADVVAYSRLRFEIVEELSTVCLPYLSQFSALQ